VIPPRISTVATLSGTSRYLSSTRRICARMIPSAPSAASPPIVRSRSELGRARYASLPEPAASLSISCRTPHSLATIACRSSANPARLSLPLLVVSSSLSRRSSSTARHSLPPLVVLLEVARPLVSKRLYSSAGRRLFSRHRTSSSCNFRVVMRSDTLLAYRAEAREIPSRSVRCPRDSANSGRGSDLHAATFAIFLVQAHARDSERARLVCCCRDASRLGDHPRSTCPSSL